MPFVDNAIEGEIELLLTSIAKLNQLQNAKIERKPNFINPRPNTEKEAKSKGRLVKRGEK